MGQLLFCSHALAKKPYDIESASLNIYSLEEMSYYLIHNAEFVEMDFVGRTFCDWVRTEIKEEGLACKLEEALEQGLSLIHISIPSDYLRRFPHPHAN